MTVTLDPITKITSDIRTAAALMSRDEARYTVDTYYQVQDFRKASANQARSLGVSGEPNEFVTWTMDQMTYVEGQIKLALGHYAKSHPVGRWALSITGIGPVISAGLLAHIDITKAPTAGHIWRFAGLDPSVSWEKGEKRPWNADLKVLCWHAGESFVKVSNNENDVYGQVYAARKRLEWARNLRGELSEQATFALRRKIGKDTDAYKYYAGMCYYPDFEDGYTPDEQIDLILSGLKPTIEPGHTPMLPPAHIHARAKRFAVKLFLSHLQHVMYETHYGTPPARPYVIEHLGHVDYMRPPHWPLDE
jgi:hypothetical protein